MLLRRLRIRVTHLQVSSSGLQPLESEHVFETPQWPTSALLALYCNAGMSGGAVGGGPAMSEGQVALQNCLPSELQESAGGSEPD